MEKIKVVEVIADTNPGGGPSHVLGILSNLDQSKFESHLICPDGFLAREAKKIKGVSVHIVEMRSKFDFSAHWEIKDTILEIESDHDPFGPIVVHTHGSRAGFLARIFLPKNIYSVYTEHSYSEGYRIANALNGAIQKRILMRLNRRTQVVVAVSSAVRDFLLREKMAYPEQVVVIPNGISVHSTQYTVHRVRSGNRAPIIGNIGNLNRQKGQEYLIGAMPEILKKFPLATLEIIGEGELRENLESRAESLGIERHISFLGSKPDVSKYLKKWDLVVLPSVVETFGISVLEAMRAGLPVVASRVGGIPDIIENKKNGLLAPSCDSGALARSIIEVLDHPAMAAKLKRGGLERVKDFDWKEVIKEIETVYSAPFELDKKNKK